jgi:hypothetical protein
MRTSKALAKSDARGSPAQKLDESGREHGPDPRSAYSLHDFSVGGHDDDRASFGLGSHEPSNDFVGDDSGWAEADANTAGSRDHRWCGAQVGAVEDHRRLDPCTSRQRGETTDELTALGLQRQGRPSKLAHVVAIDDQMSLGYGKQLLESSRIIGG